MSESADDTPRFKDRTDDMNWQPYHWRMFSDAVETLQSVVDRCEWQRENIDKAYRDRGPAEQPPAPSGNRNHKIGREAFSKPATKLYRAMVEVGPPFVRSDREQLIELLSRANEYEDRAWDNDHSANLDGKQQLAEDMLEFAEEVEAYIEELDR